MIPLTTQGNGVAVERAIDTAIADIGLEIVLRGTLKKFPGCMHWHVKRGRNSGTLEITFWPLENRAWFSIQDRRKAEWIDEAMGGLMDAIHRRIGVKLCPITPASAMIFKAVRLRALQDSPSAFGSTYSKEVQLTDADWQQRAAKWNGERSAGFLAFDGDDACGIAATFLDSEDSARAHLVSMWVAPAHRGRGVGRLLVKAIIDWARSKEIKTLHLMVTSTNDAATRFYERLGFVKTGRTEPYPNDSALLEYEMVRQIDADAND
jgi:ribosomal protein S18 acetylase RimI-like enzyme